MTKLDEAYAALGPSLIGFTCWRRSSRPEGERWCATILLEPVGAEELRQIVGHGPTPSDAQMDALVGAQ